jgi:hypothetical protein
MSFILKALKKLENEKNARKTAPVEIDCAILAPDRSSISSPRIGIKWAIIPIVLLAGAVTIYFFMHDTPPPVKTVRETFPKPAPVAQTPPPGQTIKQQAEKPEQGNARINIPAGQHAPSRHIKPEMRAEGGRLQSDFAPPSESGHQGSFFAATPGLTISGIALQDDPAESMAVVNGALVKTGATVGGAVVDRIFLDRVRFKGNGGTFEVYLSK